MENNDKELNKELTKELIEAINNLTVAVKELSANNTPIQAKIAPKPERPVWVTFAALGFLIIVSFGTGFSYWWATYFRAAVYEPAQVAATEATAINMESMESVVEIATLPVQEEVPAETTYITEEGENTEYGMNNTESAYEPSVIVYNPQHNTPVLPQYAYPPLQTYEYETETFYSPESVAYTDYYTTYVPTPTPSPQVVMDPRPEFVALWEQYGNNNIVARVYIAGTGLNALVVQAAPTAAWPVFMDMDVNLLDEDQNTVIFDSGTYAFRHILSNYADYDFFLQNPIISLNTLYEVSRWEIFSFYLAPSTFPFGVVTHSNWGDMIMQFSLASIYNTRIAVNPYDRVLTLTTASTSYPGLNYVLQARLYREITS
ncbi:MAG: class B sortase [Defluviitaleaceae bacterium]|nr:class B sortase [Defluviitaleaceae bacterium]